MKIGLVYRDALAPGGYPRDIRSLASGLANLGVSVTLFAKDGAVTEGLVDMVRVEPMEHIARSQVDLYHLFGIFIPSQLWAIHQVMDKPLVVSPMGHLMPFHVQRKAFKKRLYLQVMKPFLKRLRWFHVFSDIEALSVRSYLGDKVKTFEAGLGVFPVPSNTMKKKHDGVTCDSPMEFLFFGRNDVYQKGIDILLQGFAQAVRQGAHVRLTIAGRPWADSERYIKRFIENHGLQDAVRLLGPVEEDTKYRLLAEADYLVFLSRWDGPPRPIREAIAMGTPVIVSPETNMGDLVEAYEAGLQVQLKPEEVTAAISRVAVDRELWKHHLDGVARLRERLEWSRVAEDYVRGYKQVLAANQ